MEILVFSALDESDDLLKQFRKQNQKKNHDSDTNSDNYVNLHPIIRNHHLFKISGNTNKMELKIRLFGNLVWIIM